MIVGLGFMGSNHLNNLKALEAEGKVHIVALVDSDADRLKNRDIYTNTNLQNAIQDIHPDIVCICTNTKTHFSLIDEVLELAPDAALFVEKPLAANSSEAEQLLPRLQHTVVNCGYLFRESPAVEAAIRYIKEHSLVLEKIDTVWQKNRMEKGPARPSAGVHIDEATHPIDLVLAMLRELGYKTDDATIEEATNRRESEVGIAIVDRAMQNALYADEPDKLDPIAEVTYRLRAAGIPIEGFSSFAKGPQKREIALTCTEGTMVRLRFDSGNADHLEIGSTVLTFPAPNKLLSEWRTFLQYVETGENSWKVPTVQDMLFDIRITEALGKESG
jgi:predicted dehydrogenase